MQISKELPQFSKRSLIVVAGSRSAEILKAHEGEIESIDSLNMELPKYSDKEGFFTRSGKGETYGSGSVLEEDKRDFLAKFTKELAIRVEKAFREDSSESVYLFSPEHMKEMILEKISSEVKERIALEINGNFVEDHPFDLLKMIMDKLDDKRPVMAGEEAAKLLKKKK